MVLARNVAVGIQKGAVEVGRRVSARWMSQALTNCVAADSEQMDEFKGHVDGVFGRLYGNSVDIMVTGVVAEKGLYTPVPSQYDDVLEPRNGGVNKRSVLSDVPRLQFLRDLAFETVRPACERLDDGALLHVGEQGMLTESAPEALVAQLTVLGKKGVHLELNNEGADVEQVARRLQPYIVAGTLATVNGFGEDMQLVNHRECADVTLSPGVGLLDNGQIETLAARMGKRLNQGGIAVFTTVFGSPPLFYQKSLLTVMKDLQRHVRNDVRSGQLHRAVSQNDGQELPEEICGGRLGTLARSGYRYFETVNEFPSRAVRLDREDAVEWFTHPRVASALFPGLYSRI